MTLSDIACSNFHCCGQTKLVTSVFMYSEHDVFSTGGGFNIMSFEKAELSTRIKLIRVIYVQNVCLHLQTYFS
jgi:hypothetical protein